MSQSFPRPMGVPGPKAPLPATIAVTVETSPQAALLVTTCRCGKVVSVREVDPEFGPILTDRGRCRTCFAQDMAESERLAVSEALEQAAS